MMIILVGWCVEGYSDYGVGASDYGLNQSLHRYLPDQLSKDSAEWSISKRIVDLDVLLEPFENSEEGTTE